jgi:hypothetical protein
MPHLLGKNDLALHAITNWQYNDLSYYENVIEMYMRGVTKIGTVENVRNDLCDMLSETDSLTDSLRLEIQNSPKFNVGFYPEKFKDLFTEDLIEIVANSNKNIIDKYKYTFGG